MYGRFKIAVTPNSDADLRRDIRACSLPDFNSAQCFRQQCPEETESAIALEWPDRILAYQPALLIYVVIRAAQNVYLSSYSILTGQNYANTAVCVC
jgi:hypothetical protein